MSAILRLALRRRGQGLLSTAAARSAPEPACYAEREYRERLKACPDAFPEHVCSEDVDAFARTVFDDANLSGVALSLSDLSTAISAMRERCPVSRLVLDANSAVGHFERADVNNDGKLSWHEFRNFIREQVLATVHARQMDADKQQRRESTGALLQTPLLEERVKELMPSIDEQGMHANRLLLLGGTKPEKDAVLMRSNDYLCLTGHPMVAAAKAEALLNEPQRGERRARVFALDSPDRHRAFERRMASLLGAQDAALTVSGSHAVRGLLETICTPRAPIYADRLSWTASSLRRGLGASVTLFRHNDMDMLGGLASDEPGVIVIDGLYGNGSLGKIAEAVGIAEATGSVLVVDETHSVGCAARGLGACDEAGVAHRVHFRTLGLSKAFASRGGLIVGPARALEAFRFIDREMIFSTSPLDHEIVGYNSTLDVLLEEEWRREALHENHRHLKQGLLDLGYTDDVAISDRQIIAVVTGDAGTTMAFRNFVAERGVFGSVFCPPATRDGRSYLRFSVNCGVGEAQREHFLKVMQCARPILH